MTVELHLGALLMKLNLSVADATHGLQHRTIWTAADRSSAARRVTLLFSSRVCVSQPRGPSSVTLPQ